MPTKKVEGNDSKADLTLQDALDDLRTNPSITESPLYIFSMKEHAEESIVFLKKFYELEGDPSKTISKKYLKDMWENFINPTTGVGLTLNLPGSIPNQIIRAINKIPEGSEVTSADCVDLFRSAKEEITKLIQRDTFRRFQISPQGQALQIKLKQQSPQVKSAKRQNLYWIKYTPFYVAKAIMRFKRALKNKKNIANNNQNNLEQPRSNPQHK